MRSKMGDMDNDPSSSRSYDRDPTDDLEDELHEMEEYASQFFDEENLDVDIQSQEFSVLNQQLDQLQSALDMLESKNADIHQELLQLLQSNREVRRCLTEELAQSNIETTPEDAEAGTSSSSSTEAAAECPSGGADISHIQSSMETIKLEKCGSAN